MEKVTKMYYSIGEVSKMTNLKQYVLRYWETEFKQLSPKKNSAGNRKYTVRDIELLDQLKDLLYNKKYTINGARQLLKNNKNKQNINNSMEKLSLDKDFLLKMKAEIDSILDIIKKLKQ